MRATHLRTFGDERVPVGAGEHAVDLADQLHVVEQGVEGVEVREAHHVGGAASGGLESNATSVTDCVPSHNFMLLHSCLSRHS